MQRHDFNLTVLSYNVHGLSNKVVFRKISKYVESFDVFFVLETWIDEDKYELYKNFFNNYVLRWVTANKINSKGRAKEGFYSVIKIICNVA